MGRMYRDHGPPETPKASTGNEERPRHPNVCLQQQGQPGRLSARVEYCDPFRVVSAQCASAPRAHPLPLNLLNLTA